MIPRSGQNTAHPGFRGVDEPYDCGACVGWHARNRGFPELLPENREAWRLYFVVQDQQRLGWDLLGLDYAVLPGLFDVEGIPMPERALLYEKIALVNHAEQQRRAEQRKQDEAKRKNRVDV